MVTIHENGDISILSQSSFNVYNDLNISMKDRSLATVNTISIERSIELFKTNHELAFKIFGDNDVFAKNINEIINNLVKSLEEQNIKFDYSNSGILELMTINSNLSDSELKDFMLFDNLFHYDFDTTIINDKLDKMLYFVVYSDDELLFRDSKELRKISLK